MTENKVFLYAFGGTREPETQTSTINEMINQTKPWYVKLLNKSLKKQAS
jgi:hypothetical protein